MNTSTFQRRRAFTLIELLVVIAILAILAALLVPSISRMRKGANLSTTMNQLRQISVAINLFGQDNNNTYPAPTPPDDKGVVGPITWALTISRLNEYLGKPTQYMHQDLVAPGVRYATPAGGFYNKSEIRLTYCCTGVFFGIDQGSFPVWSEGRKVTAVANPSKAPLIFLARQRPARDGYSVTAIPRTTTPQVTTDLAAQKPENTVLFNFDLGPMPVLMADGHTEAVSFSQLKDFVKEETWRSLPK